jgi:hypothetical protein
VNNFYNFVLKILDIMIGDTKAKIGTALVFAGSALQINFLIESDKYTFSISDGTDIISILLTIIGASLLIHRYFTIKDDSITLFYGATLSNMNNKSPKNILPRREQYKTTVRDLHRINSYSKDEVLNNYQFNKTLLGERVENKESVKVYIAALGSFPYLFLLGALARNAYSNVKFLDFNRYKDGGKWYILPPFKTTDKQLTHKLQYNQNNATIEDEINRLNKNDSDVGIALGYTFQIKKEIIPSQLQNSTLYLTSSEDTRHDILSSEESQENLLKDISYYLNSLSKPKRTIHLFVSAQSSMCMNIGKHYMDNAHGRIILYNYNNETKTHDWKITFHKGVVE